MSVVAACLLLLPALGLFVRVYFQSKAIDALSEQIGALSERADILSDRTDALNDRITLLRQRLEGAPKERRFSP